MLYVPKDLTLLGSEVIDVQFESVRLVNYPPFQDLTLKFSPGVTVIAGTNGVGKSRLLSYLSSARSGYFHVHSLGDLPPVTFRGGTNDQKLIRFDANRMIPNFNVQFLRPYDARYSIDYADVQEDNFSTVGTLFTNWFVQMDNFEFRGWIQTPESAENFKLCKRIFSIMDPRYRFDKVDSNFRVLLESPHGQISFDQTSSGFQSAFLLLFGVVFGIDYFFQGKKSAYDFDGCILIDEIDVHLHPSWQGKIIRILEAIVPSAQIIATTHSPHVIQGLKETELVVLATDSKGHPAIKTIDPTPGPYGFQGWTVEEILRDVMGIEDTLSSARIKAESAFNDALDDNDLAAAQAPYDQLMSMLHPNNPLRRVYDMQFRAMGGISS